MGGDPAVLRLGMLAGEASGDRLGGGLMAQIKDQAQAAGYSEVEFVGVGGAHMLDQGLNSLADISELSVNGFRDPILKLPKLIKLLNHLPRSLLAADLHGFVGIDFNVFNFLLEARLKRAGLTTIHYVSPSVYAWRRGRAKKVAKSADLILCLYPFEPAFYAETAIKAEFVGHPLADEISLEQGSEQARQTVRADLGLGTDEVVLAVLPGSRHSEVSMMLASFLQAAERFAATHEAKVVIPCLRPELRQLIDTYVRDNTNIQPLLYDGDARQALTACDLALVKSGTSTLETMLLQRPMVVSYRLGSLTYQLVKRLVHTQFIALPNILVQRMWFPELLQSQGTGENLAAALDAEFAKARAAESKSSEFAVVHQSLARGADASAASAVLALLEERSQTGVA